MTFQLFVTQNCNLNCKYCFEGEKKNFEISELILPDLIKFIKNYTRQNFVVDKEIWINFNGGEALLRFDFIKTAVREFKLAGINHFSISTNFILADSEIMNFLVENDFTMQISLDGNKKTHDLNRIDYSGKGSFTKVYENLMKLIKTYPNAKILASMVFTPKTISSLHKNLKFLFENGFFHVISSYNSKDNWVKKDFKILKQEARKCRKLYINMFKQNKPVYFKLFSQNIEDFFSVYGKTQCGICKDLIGILPNGNVLACGALIGNLHEQDFIIGSVFSSKLNMEIIRKSLNTKIENKSCNCCALKERCHNDCQVCNFDCTGDVSNPDPVGCMVNKIFIKESDKIILKLIENQSFRKSFKIEKAN